MTTLTTTKRPLRKLTEYCDSEVKTYETSPCGCGFVMVATFSTEDRDYCVYDEAGFVCESASTLAEANELASAELAAHKATCTAPPTRMPKVGDHGFARYYEWDCPTCQTHWEGKWDNPLDEYGELTGGSEPYSLTQDGKEVGSYSYETAADMHADFVAAVAEHTCEPPEDNPPLAASCPECDWGVEAQSLGGSTLYRLEATDTPEGYAACEPQSGLITADEAAASLLAKHQEDMHSDHYYVLPLAELLRQMDAKEAAAEVPPAEDDNPFAHRECEACGGELWGDLDTGWTCRFCDYEDDGLRVQVGHSEISPSYFYLGIYGVSGFMHAEATTTADRIEVARDEARKALSLYRAHGMLPAGWERTSRPVRPAYKPTLEEEREAKAPAEDAPILRSSKTA